MSFAQSPEWLAPRPNHLTLGASLLSRGKAAIAPIPRLDPLPPGSHEGREWTRQVASTLDRLQASEQIVVVVAYWTVVPRTGIFRQICRTPPTNQRDRQQHAQCGLPRVFPARSGGASYFGSNRH